MVESTRVGILKRLTPVGGWSAVTVAVVALATLTYQIGFDQGEEPRGSGAAQPAVTVTEAATVTETATEVVTEVAAGVGDPSEPPSTPSPSPSGSNTLVYDPAGSTYNARRLRIPSTGDWDLDIWAAGSSVGEIDLHYTGVQLLIGAPTNSDVDTFAQGVAISEAEALGGVETCRTTTGYTSYRETRSSLRLEEGQYFCVRTDAGALAMLQLLEESGEGELISETTLWPS